MAINYKKMVNSGHDYKILVEKCVEGLMRAGLPASEIRKNKNFIFPHEDMLRRLRSNYTNKEIEYITTYETVGEDPYTQLISDDYFVITHSIKELYPDTDEDKELFMERDSLKEKIDFLKNGCSLKLEKDRNSLVKKMAKLEANNPILDRIREYVAEYDEMIKMNNGVLPEPNEISALMTKHSLSIKDCQKNGELYNKYIQLEKEIDKVSSELELSKQNKYNEPKILEYEARIKEIESHLINKNTKLVNWLLRTYFGNISFEMEDAYQECVVALWNAIKNYDYKKGSFSTLAVLYMKHAVEHNLKTLTGYTAYSFWKKREVDSLLETFSQYYQRQFTVDELIETGILGMSAETAKNVSILQNAFPISEAKIFYRSFDQSDEDRSIKEEFESKGYIDDDSQIDRLNYDPDEPYENEFDGLETMDDYELEKAIAHELLRGDLNKILSTLTERERAILELRFGLRDGQPHTLEETGKYFNINRERARQIEAKALRKLRHPSRSNVVRDYLPELESRGRYL